MIIIVSTNVPPEHSGAGKRIYKFYNYLKEKGYKARLVTHTNISEETAVVIPRHSTKLPGKMDLLSDLVKSFFLLLKNFAFIHLSKDETKVAWLVSCGPLTVAASIFFYLFGYRIITQNTLVGSDDPIFRYPGDILGIKFRLKRLQYYLSDCITSMSPSLYNLSVNYHPHCVMVPNPVDPKYRPGKLSFHKTKESATILFVGKLSVRKGVDIVFNTINLVHKIDPSTRFVLVGPKDESDHQLDNLFTSLSYINKNNVNFAGFQIEPCSYFAAADIFFMPSRREGFPTVFNEAMASGLPVVAKTLDGITDYIFGEDYHTILNTEDSEAYAKAILSLIEDRSLYERLSKQGVELMKRFEEKKIYRDYIGLLTK